MPRMITSVLAILTIVWCVGMVQGGETEKAPVTISVIGESVDSAGPDSAEIRLGVSLKKSTASDAFRSLMTDMERVVEAMKKNGIDEKDLRTDNISLDQAYTYKGNESVPDGYVAAQGLRVTIRDRSAVASTLQVAVDNGANNFYGLAWHIDAVKQEEWREKALPDAIAKANVKAKVLAALLGKELGELRSFAEYARTQQLRYTDANSGAEDTVPSGEQELRVTVTMTYELK